MVDRIATRCDRLHSPWDSAVSTDFVTLLLKQQIEITNPANGKSCTATVRDLCPGCGNDSLGSSPSPSTCLDIDSHLPCSPPLDMSPAVFEFLEGDLGVGIFHVLWYFE